MVLLRGAESGAADSGVELRRAFGISAQTEIASAVPVFFATTTGYQTRAFGEAAERLGVELVFATDRCNMLEDPGGSARCRSGSHDEDRVGRRDPRRRATNGRSTACSRLAIGRR